MNLAPLLDAGPVIQLHTAAALLALALGALQLLRAKGTGGHRVLGCVWAGAMMTAAGSSLWIHGIDQWRGFSLIHLLSIYALVAIPTALLLARRGKIQRHRIAMHSAYWTGLVLPGVLTLLPGRILSRVIFGG